VTEDMPGGGRGSRQSLTNNEETTTPSDEFADQLKSLESTMKKHLITMSVVSPSGTGTGTGENEGFGEGNNNKLAAPAPPLRSLSRLRREGTRINGPRMPNRKDKVIRPVTHSYINVTFDIK